MACDIRLASTEARIGFPEVGLGIFPGLGGTQRTTRLVGRGRAWELEAVTLTFGTENQKEGMTAFLERRKPEFKGC